MKGLFETIAKLRVELNQLKEEISLLRRCDECKKGPCIGRLFKGRSGFVFPNSLYLFDGKIYARKCSMMTRVRVDLSQVEIKYNNVDRLVNLTPNEIEIENCVGCGDLPIIGE